MKYIDMINKLASLSSDMVRDHLVVVTRDFAVGRHLWDKFVRSNHDLMALIRAMDNQTRERLALFLEHWQPACEECEYLAEHLAAEYHSLHIGTLTGDSAKVAYAKRNIKVLVTLWHGHHGYHHEDGIPF